MQATTVTPAISRRVFPQLASVRARSGACAIAIAAALGGCALSTPPDPQATLSSALPAGTRVAPAWAAASATGSAAAVENGWLKSFNDPQLDTIVAEAIAHNPDLRQAAAAVTAAREAVAVVGAQLMPQVGVQLGATARQDRDNGSFDSTFAALGVGWEMDVWGRLRALTAASQATADAVALDYAFARQSLAATTAKLWFLAADSNQLVALSEQTVKIFTELLGLVQQRRAAGKDTDLNVVDIRAKLESAQSALVAARQANETSRRALELLLGRYPSAEIRTATSFAPLSAPPATGLPASLLERRPDLLAARQQVLAAFRQEESAKLALLPDFSLALQGGRLGSGLLSVLGLNPWLAAAQIGMSIPIYEGGALRAQVQIATAQQEQAVARYGGAALKAFAEVENALAGERFLRERLPFDERALADHTRAVEIATIQFKYGQRDILWVGNLQVQQLGNQEEVLRTRTAQRINRVQLLLALGGGFGAEPAAAASRLP